MGTIKLLVFSVLATAAASLAAMWGWQTKWPEAVYLCVFLFISAIALLFVIARHARGLEEPKIRTSITLWASQFSGNTKVSETFAIEIENASRVRIDNVECLVTRLVFPGLSMHNQINRQLPFVDTNSSTSTSLNPLAKKYAILFEYGIGTPSYYIEINGSKYRPQKGEMVIEVELSAEQSPAEIKCCRLATRPTGELEWVSLVMEDRNGTRQASQS